MINREFFFQQVKRTLFDGTLRQTQVDGLTNILDGWNAKYAKKDDRWLAYMLATAHHETDRTIRPIREYGRGKHRSYGKPDPVTRHAYYGRRYVQLTWKYNYDAMGKILSLNLVNNPDLALDPKHALDIMCEGMTRGTFTGKKLTSYFNPTTNDWRNARRIINGLDKADLIAGYGQEYYAAISYTT
jgi:putative chitinase